MCFQEQAGVCPYQVSGGMEFNATNASHSLLECLVLQHSPSQWSRMLNDDQDELRKQLQRRGGETMQASDSNTKKAKVR